MRREIIKEFQGNYRFLSNFWPAKVMLYGEKYNSVEHAYQAAKMVVPEARKLIQQAKTPGEAKRIARRLNLRKDWDNIKLDMMEHLVRQKFSDNKDLKNLLLQTGNMYLQEGNSWNDRFWGVDLRSGIGENNLGKILMRIRRELK